MLEAVKFDSENLTDLEILLKKLNEPFGLNLLKNGEFGDLEAYIKGFLVKSEIFDKKVKNCLGKEHRFSVISEVKTLLEILDLRGRVRIEEKIQNSSKFKFMLKKYIFCLRFGEKKEVLFGFKKFKGNIGKNGKLEKRLEIRNRHQTAEKPKNGYFARNSFKLNGLKEEDEEETQIKTDWKNLSFGCLRDIREIEENGDLTQEMDCVEELVQEYDWEELDEIEEVTKEVNWSSKTKIYQKIENLMKKMEGKKFEKKNPKKFVKIKSSTAKKLSKKNTKVQAPKTQIFKKKNVKKAKVAPLLKKTFKNPSTKQKKSKIQKVAIKQNKKICTNYAPNTERPKIKKVKSTKNVKQITKSNFKRKPKKTQKSGISKLALKFNKKPKIANKTVSIGLGSNRINKNGGATGKRLNTNAGAFRGFTTPEKIMKGFGKRRMTSDNLMTPRGREPLVFSNNTSQFGMSFGGVNNSIYQHGSERRMVGGPRKNGITTRPNNLGARGGRDTGKQRRVTSFVGTMGNVPMGRRQALYSFKK